MAHQPQITFPEPVSKGRSFRRQLIGFSEIRNPQWEHYVFYSFKHPDFDIIITQYYGKWAGCGRNEEWYADGEFIGDTNAMVKWTDAFANQKFNNAKQSINGK